MNSYNPSLEAQQQPEELATTESSQQRSSESMREYYQLQKTLFLVILALAGIIFGSVWFFYSLNIALNYLLGACVGGLYLRRLAKDIEGLGSNQKRLGLGRLGLFIALMIAATQLRNLHIVPIFLGFLTYKAAIIVYVVQTSLLPVQK